MAAALAAWLIVCAGEGVLAWFAQRYFAAELADGTPFTEGGAKALNRLGILTICLPPGCATLADLAQAIIAGHMRVNADFAADICFDNSSHRTGRHVPRHVAAVPPRRRAKTGGLTPKIRSGPMPFGMGLFYT